MKRIIYLIVGCLFLSLGCVGIVLPILPTVPFFLVTAFCFAKSSEKLHKWFMGTKLYKKHMESFIQKKGMTLQTKLTIMGSVTLMMAVGFLMMSRVPVGRIALAIVWFCHLAYFIFGVRTLSATGSESDPTA